MNKSILINGQLYSIGPEHPAIRVCGFSCREAVTKAAISNSTGEPVMRLDDVAEWFLNH